jgi:hypothetical protein
LVNRYQPTERRNGLLLGRIAVELYRNRCMAGM